MGEPDQEDSRTAARRARADRYFKEHLQDQRSWYSRKASALRSRAQALSLTVLLGGGLTAFVQIFQASEGPAKLVPAQGWPSWPVIISGLLSLLIVAAEGLARIGRYQETWISYRKASEQMKREYRLYINGAGAYEQIQGEDPAYLAFVANIEQIIAEEQQLYWRSASDAGAAKPQEQPQGG
jgi:hypothetical protein